MKKAILVGINKYSKSPLTCSVKDAEAVGRLLGENENESDNFHVRVYRDVPTRGDLKHLIHETFKDDDEASLFYYSGHGSSDNYNGYLVTPDATKHDLGVSVNDLLVVANASKARNKIIILDCCYSGKIGSVNAIGGTTAFINEGVTILAASRAHQKSIESPVRGHSIFTYLLIEALKGGAADISGHITLGSIYSYIDKSLGAFAQRPVFKTNITGFFPLRTIEPKISLKVLRKLVEYFPDPNYQYPLDPSYEDTNAPGKSPAPVEPFAIKQNTIVFKHLQAYQGAALVVPVGPEFMYFAAMESKTCKLTPLGQHYWHLAKNRH